MDKDQKYEYLADYLSDHLWMRNSLDFEFLKQFPEFLYQGKGFRVLFLEPDQEVGDLTHQSFAKTIEGAKEFIYNTETFNKDCTSGKKTIIVQCQISGFDVQKALVYFKENNMGLTKKTIENFSNEEEVLAFSYKKEKELLFLKP